LNVNPLFRGPVSTDLEFPRSLTSGTTFGGKLGTWFSKTGFPKIDYPDWMKYTGFYLDFSYNGAQKSSLTGDNLGSRRIYIYPSDYPHYTHYKFWGSASWYYLGFMFAFRYGFHPTEKVPFGKLQPYVAVGPAIFITSFKPTYYSQTTFINFFTDLNGFPRTATGSNQTVVSPGFATEIGLRYMITRFLSVETSCKYRYTAPSFSYDDIQITGFNHQLKFAPEFNMFSMHVGVGYHF
jgi:hypothetical protein